MSLPFAKGRNQDNDEKNVNQENLLEARPQRAEDKRWRGFEFGFKLRITKVRRKSRGQQGKGLGVVPNAAALDAQNAPDPSDDWQYEEKTLAGLLCLTPPTDPNGG